MQKLTRLTRLWEVAKRPDSAVAASAVAGSTTNKISHGAKIPVSQLVNALLEMSSFVGEPAQKIYCTFDILKIMHIRVDFGKGDIRRRLNVCNGTSTQGAQRL